MGMLYEFFNCLILKEENGEICKSGSECKGGLCVVYGPIMISLNGTPVVQSKRCSCPLCPVPLG
jgi:hypothetical protein